MMRIYILGLVIMIVVAVYFSGVSIGRSKCVADMSVNSAQIAQQQLIKKEKINVSVNRRSVADIRDVLRAKYTIAE